MNMLFRFWAFSAGILGAVGVMLAAWSSHGLAQFVAADALPVALARAQAANLHHLLHSLALLAVAIWARACASRMVHVAGLFFFLGILGFSGGIYAIRIFADIQAGPLIYIVPAGGICLILGWLAVALAAATSSAAHRY